MHSSVLERIVLKPGPARRVDPGPGRPGPGTGPGLSKNPLGSWPGGTRSTRVNPVETRPVFIYIYTHTHVKLRCFCCFCLLQLLLPFRNQLVVVLQLGDGEDLAAAVDGYGVASYS